MTLIEKGNKGQTLSCDDFGLRAFAVLRGSRRGGPLKSLQAGPCSCGTLCWLDHMAGEGRTQERRETSNLQAAGNIWDFFFFLWFSEAGCVERPIISQLPLK